MSEKDFATQILELLNELEQRVLADPALAAEYTQQQAAFPAPAGDQHSALRFREWFLLEHSPPTLGAPPILAWSPKASQDGSTWEALLGARFGIFSPVEGAQEAVFEELWTGRRSELVAAPSGGETELLMVGWFAPLGDEIELPLPGARALVVPGLEQALIRDLAQARMENPRGRLSHLACEQMMLAIANANANAPGTATKGVVATVDLEAELEALLLRVDPWSVDRALDVLAIDGDAALLEQLAFDTDVDLDALRRLLQGYRESLADGAESGAGIAPSAKNIDVDAETVATALKAFDSDPGGGTVEERFSALETALGLAAGSTEENSPLENEEAEQLGPGIVPGLTFWIASWAWEMEQTDVTPSEQELKILAAWADFVTATRVDPIDAAELHRTDLTGFLLACPDQDQLQDRIDGLVRFLSWLDSEQQASFGGLANELENALGLVLKLTVTANAELAQVAVRADANTLLIATEPPTVEAEDGQSVIVEGLPDAALQNCQVGDRVMGHWAAGHFRAARWIPEKLLPSVPQTS